VFGEAGLSLGSEGPKFRVPEASQLRWLFLHDLDLGRRGSIFVGRSAGRAAVVSTFEREQEDSSRASGQGVATTSSHFPECERIGGQAGLEGILFWDSNSSLLCFGNTGSSPFSGVVSVTLRSKSFSTALFAQMEELRQETGLWSTVERVKLLSRFETKVELRPNSWKMLRLSRVTQ